MNFSCDIVRATEKSVEAGIKSLAITTPIFYPNQIATELVDIQPLDGVGGSVFILKPRFSNSLPANTPGRVLAGDEIFVNRTYYYASEVSGQVIGTGDGVKDILRNIQSN